MPGSQRDESFGSVLSIACRPISIGAEAIAFGYRKPLAIQNGQSEGRDEPSRRWHLLDVVVRRNDAAVTVYPRWIERRSDCAPRRPR